MLSDMQASLAKMPAGELEKATAARAAPSPFRAAEPRDAAVHHARVALCEYALRGT